MKPCNLQWAGAEEEILRLSILIMLVLCVNRGICDSVYSMRVQPSRECSRSAENPQGINAFMERLGMGAGGGFGGPAGLGGAGVPPVADPEAAYATQLEQLQVAVTIVV